MHVQEELCFNLGMYCSSWCVHLIAQVLQMFQSKGFLSQVKGWGGGNDTVGST